MAIVISLSMFKEKCSRNFSVSSPHVFMPVGKCANHSSAIPVRLLGNSHMRYVGLYAMSIQAVENSLMCSSGLPLPLYLGKFGMT